MSFSHREDTEVLKLFFSLLKAEVGNIPSECIMTDDAIQYHTAWAEVFETPQQSTQNNDHLLNQSNQPSSSQQQNNSTFNTSKSRDLKRLLCWWHVLKSINKNVYSKLK